jgi:5-methyltetrahydrofolate--homocysteine methyltransferase
MADMNELKESLISGNANKVKELVQKAIDEEVPVEEILNNGLIAGMGIIGERFKKNEVYVPEVLIAARAMNQGMELMEPLIAKSGIKPMGHVAVGTVKGDLHDIGKNLVVMMLKGAGFKVNDLGIDVSAEKFVEAAKEEDAQIVAMSALLTTTMTSMKEVVDALKEAGLDGKVKTLVGGAPLTQSYADEIKADGYAPDASSAVDKAKEVLGL